MARRALCVGINTFEHMPPVTWLRGCVNDAEDFRDLLTQQYGFTPEEVTVLTDGAATRARILAELHDAVAAAQAGEVNHLVFTLSSHGTQLVDAVGGDEADRVDEAVAASDLEQDGDAWSRDTLIVDDELFDLVERVPEDVLLDVVLDTCHSGSGLEVIADPTRRPRFLPPPVPARAARSPLPETAAPAARPPRHVLLAACRSYETAADALFDGRYSGAFTHHLVRALRADPDAGRGEIVRRVREELDASRFDQVPQLEAPDGAPAVPWGRPYRVG